ncbi:MAG: ATP-binding cassette domain-containing protein [Gemmatimonadota bacterium]|nr:ATP-binding cassette domain-containing protein [Gemmatimonadota bacterium]
MSGTGSGERTGGAGRPGGPNRTGVAGEPLLRAESLVKEYAAGRSGPGFRRGAAVRAVDGIDLEVRPRETVALVGESGSGKSTTARLLLGLEEPTAGRVLWRGRDIATLDRAGRREFRRCVQVVFQDPFGALNPRLTVGAMLREVLAVHGLARGREAGRRVEELLGLVGLDPAVAARWPHEFSGGQRQRIGIARALSVEPELVVCDEPISALDVSVQAQVLNLLAGLQQRLGLALLFISHDLGVVRHVAARTAVMRHGRIVERGPTADVFARPQHSYTRELLAARIPLTPAERAE